MQDYAQLSWAIGFLERIDKVVSLTLSSSTAEYKERKNMLAIFLILIINAQEKNKHLIFGRSITGGGSYTAENI